MRYIWLIGCFLMVGCQNMPNQDAKIDSKSNRPQKTTQSVKLEKDGAPPGALPRLFRKVIPVSLPLSRYGNPDRYQVDGKTYEVMRSSSGYRARGLASWYGTKFHKQRTSSGEKYDMYELTAAHKTLPIPCYVRVRNIENNRVAIVKVNDRGPFHKDRILDLSYAAAAKLGLFPKGTAMVEIEVLKTSNQNTKPARYYLQAGAFDSKERAEAFRQKLSQLSRAHFYIEPYQHQFLVRAGPFAERQMSDRLRHTLNEHGIRDVFSLLM